MLGSIFMASVIAFGSESVYLCFVKMLFKLGTTWAALILPGFYLTRLLARRRMSIDVTILIAPLITIAFATLLFLVLYSVNAPHVAYTAAIVAGAAVLFWQTIRAGLLRDILRVRLSTQIFVGLAIAASLIALLFVSAGSIDPQREVSSWELVAKRFWWPLPVDNNLQYDTAEVFIHKKPPWRWDTRGAEWTMGDRPPLVGILNAVYGSFFLGALSFWDYEVNGAILNALFLLPLGALALILFKRRSVAIGVVAVCALNTYMFLNIYFTWPKMAGLYFSLCAMLIAVVRLPETARFAFVGAACGLGAMCHAGALLSLPTVCCYLFFTQWRKPFLRRIGAIALCAAVCLAVQVPWSVYKKLHPEIDTNKLMYHYLPAEYVPKANYSRDIQNALMRFVRETPVTIQIQHRLDNVLKVFTPHQTALLNEGIIKGRWNRFLSAYGANEFYWQITAIGEFPLIAAGLLLLFRLAQAVRQRSLSMVKRDLAVAAIAAIAVLFYLVNVAARWGDPYNHELPCFELCIVMLCVWGYCWWQSRLLGVFLLIATALRWLLYTIAVLYKPSAIFDFYHTVSLFLVLAIVLFVCAISYLRRTIWAGKVLWTVE